jgi:serine/threonine-protein kinase
MGVDRTEERLRKAELAVQKALTLDPELAEAHLAYGWFHYVVTRDYERAHREVALAELGLPENHRVMSVLGALNSRQGKLEKAIEYNQRSLRLSPRDAGTAFELSVLYTALRRFEEAEAYSNLALSLAPDSRNWFTFRFLIHVGEGELQKVREMIQQYPRASSDIRLWYKLESYERNYTAALERVSAYRETFENQRVYGTRTMKAAWIYLFMGQRDRSMASFDSARVLLEEKLENSPDDERIHASLGLAYAGLGQKEEALRHGQRAVELMPVSKDAMNGPLYEQSLAIIYVLLGDQEAALDKVEYLLSIPSLWMSVGILRFDPVWDPLRDHPRFKALIEKHSDAD